MGTRRDIRKIDNGLKDHRYVLSIALYKSFARSPAYWIDLYCKSRPNVPLKWTGVLQWSFPRQGEQVEGYAVITDWRSPTQAAEWIEARADKKIDEGWLYHSLEVDPLFKSHAIVDYVEEATKKWDKGSQTKTGSRQRFPRPPKTKTKAERFRELQKKRKAKAEW
jgi:hypothetical protein